MSVVFKSEAAKAAMSGWYERFLARLTVPAESVEVPSNLGPSHLLVAGPKDAPPLVLVHGAMAGAPHAMRELGPLLERFRVYAPDIPGQSPRAPDARPAVDSNAYGEWLVSVLDGLGLSKVSLYGVSWGGFVALRTAIHAPRRIERLALLVPAGFVGGDLWAGVRRLAIPMALYRAFPSQKRLERFTRNLFTSPDPEWATYIGEAVRSYRMDMRIPKLANDAELARVTMPAMVFGADDDVHFTGSEVVARARALPNLVHAELLAGTRHCPPFTDDFRGKMAEKLGPFLAPRAAA